MQDISNKERPLLPNGNHERRQKGRVRAIMRPAHIALGFVLILLIASVTRTLTSLSDTTRSSSSSSRTGSISSSSSSSSSSGSSSSQGGPNQHLLPTQYGWCPKPSSPFPVVNPFPANFWYVKTYKTGSTTLSSVFNSICQHYGVVWLKWDEMKLVFQMNDKGPKPTQFQQGMKAAIDKVANSSDFKYTAITSHIPYSEQAAELFARPLMRFTSVRHPVARVHSHFIQTLCFWTAVRQGWKPFAPLNTSGPPGPSACDSGDDSTYMQLATANDTVEHRYDFAKKHFQQNLMYWYMRGDVRGVEAAAAQYDFIFVSERMNEALVIFMLQYGLTYEDIAYLPSKVRTGKYKTAKDMPDHLNDYILSVNQHDMQLWQLANKRLDEKRAELVDACGADIVSAALESFEQLLDEIRAECSDYQGWYESHGFDGSFTYSGSPGIGDESGLGFRCVRHVTRRFVAGVRGAAGSTTGALPSKGVV